MRSDKYGLWKGHTRWAPPLAGLTGAEREALARAPVPRDDGSGWMIAALFLVLTNAIAFGIGFALGAGGRLVLKALGYGV